MAEAPDRAVIYRRVSSADQVDGTSLDTQRLDCLRLVEREGLALAQEWDFVDEGRSGASTDRPGLNALRHAASRAQFEVVVVAKADRLSRNHLDHLTLVRFFETLGIRLITTEGDLIGRTPEQRLQRNILGVIAEFEREQILRRTRQGLRATALDGGWPGGRAPFGFSLDRSTRTGHTRLIVNDEEAAVLRRACELIVDEGLSTVQAAERLNDLGLRPRNASRWTYVNLRKTLRLSALSGTWTYRLSPTQDRPDGEAIDLAVPSLISRERHLRLLEILAKKSTVVKADRRGKQYLLGRGRMTSPCGRNFHGRAQSDRPAVYACANVGPDATGDCECYRIPADQIGQVPGGGVADVHVVSLG